MKKTLVVYVALALGLNISISAASVIRCESVISGVLTLNTTNSRWISDKLGDGELRRRARDSAFELQSGGEVMVLMYGEGSSRLIRMSGAGATPEVSDIPCSATN